jgi:hypothetical protein
MPAPVSFDGLQLVPLAKHCHDGAVPKYSVEDDQRQG